MFKIFSHLVGYIVINRYNNFIFVSIYLTKGIFLSWLPVVEVGDYSEIINGTNYGKFGILTVVDK